MTNYSTKLKNYLTAEICRFSLLKAGFTISDPVLEDAMDKSWKLFKDLKSQGYTVEELSQITNNYLNKIED